MDKVTQFFAILGAFSALCGWCRPGQGVVCSGYQWYPGSAGTIAWPSDYQGTQWQIRGLLLYLFGCST